MGLGDAKNGIQLLSTQDITIMMMITKYKVYM